MIGEYEVNVRNKDVEYTFKVNRKISLLTGRVLLARRL